MTNWETLAQLLRKLEGRSYKEYKGIQGDYAFPTYVLSVDHVQGDPFAAPSRKPTHRSLRAHGAVSPERAALAIRRSIDRSSKWLG